MRIGTGAASSHPRARYRGCPGSWGKACHSKYMMTSTFSYKGLGYPGGQKYNNYDQFLRSNIDNEQDNRNFNDDEGYDHLPFRTHVHEGYQKGHIVKKTYCTNRYDGQPCRGMSNLTAVVNPGETKLVPMRWNNPHASELEINIWIFDHDGKMPVVVPIRKPTCSGEGYQNNAIKFTVPTDFTQLGGKIPGFKGCNYNTEPMCALQIYSHSVESRQYASAFPIIIPGHNWGVTTTSLAGIQTVSKDPWYDLSSLRDLCLPATDPSADITTSNPRWARLVSDVYTHSYMNSDFSPYSGQQHESISKNMQTSAVNKMVTGNRGELGQSILTAEQYSRIRQLQTLEDRIYKNYESIANKIINTVGDQMKNTGAITAGPDGEAKLATCFRCAEVGSIGGSRIQTNTYIPSFQLPTSLVARARQVVPSRYSDLISQSGQVRIYEQSMMDLQPFFFVSQQIGILYQEAMLKDTVKVKPDAAQFKKRDANGKTDKGVYAATTAKTEFAQSQGCPKQCLYCQTAGFKPVISGSRATCITGECTGCLALFNNFHKATPPKVTSLASSIVKNGLPGGMGGDAVRGYPDVDGSPRVGRPTQRPGDAPFPTVTPPSWEFTTEKPAVNPSTTQAQWPSPSPWPTPNPTPTPSPDAKVIDWKIPMEPQAITVPAGTKVTFKWSGYHNLAETSEDNFKACTTSGNKEIAPGSPGGSVDITMPKEGTKYYICEVGGHCSFGQKLAITVGGGAPTPTTTPSPEARRRRRRGSSRRRRRRGSRRRSSRRRSTRRRRRSSKKQEVSLVSLLQEVETMIQGSN